jgi:hypothetical protein
MKANETIACATSHVKCVSASSAYREGNTTRWLWDHVSQGALLELPRFSGQVATWESWGTSMQSFVPVG